MKPHTVIAHFNALRHEGDVGNRDEESIPFGVTVNVKECWFEGPESNPVAVVLFDFDDCEWDAMFDTPDENGVLAPIGTLKAVSI